MLADGKGHDSGDKVCPVNQKDSQGFSVNLILLLGDRLSLHHSLEPSSETQFLTLRVNVS